MLREIDTFLAVVHQGSFSSAGAVIGLTQSAVSAQIQRLENALGAALFDRVGRRVHLNARGRASLPLLQNMRTLFDEAQHGGVSAPVRGALRIGAISSVHLGLLPDALGRFRDAFPEVRIRVLPGVSWNLLNQVDADELGLAIVIKPPMPMSLPAGIHWQTLWREPYAVIVPPDTDIDDWRDALTRLPFIRYDRSAFGGRQVDQFLRRENIAVNDAFELDEFDTIEALVAKGHGATLIPLVDAERLKRRQLHTLSLGNDTFYREVGVASRSERRDGDLTGRLIDTLVQTAALDTSRQA